MKCTIISFLDNFYRTEFGRSFVSKISRQLVDDSDIFHNRVLAIGFCNPYLNEIDNDNLYCAIPKLYPLYRWPKVRPFKTIAVDEKSLPFLPSTWEVIVVIHFAELYDSDINNVIKEIRRVLKANGTLIIVMINKYSFIFNSIFSKSNIQRKNIKYGINDIVDNLINHKIDIINIIGINSNFSLWPHSFNYVINKYIDSISLNFPMIADIAIIKAKKLEFSPEIVEELTPQYEI